RKFFIIPRPIAFEGKAAPDVGRSRPRPSLVFHLNLTIVQETTTAHRASVRTTRRNLDRARTSHVFMDTLVLRSRSGCSRGWRHPCRLFACSGAPRKEWLELVCLRRLESRCA